MIDLESLKAIFADTRRHIGIGKIKKVSVASDRSHVKVLVQGLPDGMELVARVTWDLTGPNAGIFMLPVVDDLVLVAWVDGNDNDAYVIRRLSSSVDKIPQAAADGHLVARALAGKKTVIASDSRINLARGDDEPEENLVLGQQLKSLLSTLIGMVADLSDKVSSHTHIGNLGYPTSAPNQAADFTTLKADLEEIKASPVDDEEILSDFSFTEK